MFKETYNDVCGSTTSIPNDCCFFLVLAFTFQMMNKIDVRTSEPIYDSNTISICHIKKFIKIRFFKKGHIFMSHLLHIISISCGMNVFTIQSRNNTENYVVWTMQCREIVHLPCTLIFLFVLR